MENQEEPADNFWYLDNLTVVMAIHFAVMAKIHVVAQVDVSPYWYIAIAQVNFLTNQRVQKEPDRVMSVVTMSVSYSSVSIDLVVDLAVMATYFAVIAKMQ